MGSAAPSTRDPARALLLQIRVACLQASESGEEVDPSAIAALIADSLESQHTRCAVLMGLAEYLICTGHGAIPRLDRSR